MLPCCDKLPLHYCVMILATACLCTVMIDLEHCCPVVKPCFTTGMWWPTSPLLCDDQLHCFAYCDDLSHCRGAVMTSHTLWKKNISMHQHYENFCCCCAVKSALLRIYLLARRNLLWDILRLPSSRRAAQGLYVILTLWRTQGANQRPYTLLHRMDEWCFRPLLCTVKAELGRGKPGLMRWIWDETLPQCSIDRSTFYTAAHCATKWASGRPLLHRSSPRYATVDNVVQEWMYCWLVCAVMHIIIGCLMLLHVSKIVYQMCLLSVHTSMFFLCSEKIYCSCIWNWRYSNFVVLYKAKQSGTSTMEVEI